MHSEVAIEYLAVLEDAQVQVVTVGEQGPAGRAGIPGPAGGSAFQRIAGQALSALRIVYEQDGLVYLMSPTDSDHIDQLLGITLTAADAGDELNVQRTGELNDASWSWSPGRIWLGAAGLLTQTPPASGFDVLIGAAVSATRIILNIQDPIELE